MWVGVELCNAEECAGSMLSLEERVCVSEKGRESSILSRIKSAMVLFSFSLSLALFLSFSLSRSLALSLSFSRALSLSLSLSLCDRTLPLRE
jgi:hypothetical protein